MDISKVREKIPKWFYKFRYPIAIALIGIVLLLIPIKKEDNIQQPISTTETK